MTGTSPSSALQALLTGLIDYAGLFPPAGVAMDDAVRNYDSYWQHEHAWMLGRFIVPAARLDELSESLARTGVDAAAWRLSVLATAADAHIVSAFHHPAIDTLEIRANTAEQIQQAAAALAGKYQLYFEVPPQQWASLLKAVGVARSRAKIRTGGEIPEAVPPEGSVIQFLRLARERQLAFKATAGLHHPLRGVQRLTYAAESPIAVTHGFVNLFCAATLLWHEPAMGQEAAWMLAERDPDAITMEGDTMVWQNSSAVLTTQQIREARERFCIGFGSCSFIEPVADLEALGWL